MGHNIGKIRCEGCGLLVPNYDCAILVSEESPKQELCSACFNLVMAKNTGCDKFTNVCFDPIEMIDAAGDRHLFQFRTQLLGDILSIEALEIQEEEVKGYQFQILGRPEDDQLVLLGGLIQKMRRSLSVRHLVDDERYGLSVVGNTVRGRFEWDDDSDDELPLLVIDGREIAWYELGEILKIFEGYQFKLEIIDPSEDVS